MNRLFLLLLLPMALIVSCGQEDEKPEPKPELQRLTMKCDTSVRLTKYPYQYVVDIKATHEQANVVRDEINGRLWLNHSNIDDTWTECRTIKSPFIDWPQGETRNIRCTAFSLDEEPPLRNVYRVAFVPDGVDRGDAIDFCRTGPVDQEVRDRQEYVNYEW